ncbi:hypothetical protein ACSQ67_009058 [Phaseolus vulgaris]
MASCNIFLVLILVNFLTFETTQAETVSDPVYIYHSCSGGNTTDGSTFQSNLKTLLSSLSDNAPGNNGFYNNTVPSQNPSDSVFGLFMCRGEVPSQLCQHCVQNATRRLSSECSLAKQAVIWYDECTLRYSNTSFFSTVSLRPKVGLLNTANISNQESFMELLFQTMNKTADAAASAVENKFAINQAIISEFQSLYCLAQCTPDLSLIDCRRCLSGAIGDLPWCCQGKQGGRILYPSCNVRYELYPFYRSTEAPEDSELSKDPLYLSHNCSTNVTSDSNFKVHLSSLFSYMSSNATNQMDYKDGVEDTVYGLFMCRGDLPSRLCQQCVLNATHRIFSECNSFQEAVIWYSHCMLRYSYRHFFSKVEKSLTFQSLINTFNDVTEQNLFTYGLTKALYNLLESAHLSSARYVTKSSQMDDSQTLYVLAQCTQDLLGDDCMDCLEDINKNMPFSQLGNTGGRILYPSCNLRYEFFQFYRDPQLQGPGNSSPPVLKEKGKRQLETIISIVLPTTASVILFIFVYYLIKRKARRSAKSILRENFGYESATLEPLQFSLAVIQAATNNFSNENKIGRGGFGEVYKWLYVSEYAMFGQFSDKSDVFSFGVMVLEIITGKRNSTSYDQPHGVANSLLSYVWRQWRDETILSILDPSIKEKYSELEVLICIQIGLLCVQQNPHARPSMVKIVSYFSNHLVELPRPEEPTFFLHGTMDSKESSSRPSSSGCIPLSVNEMPTSQFLPR